MKSPEKQYMQLTLNGVISNEPANTAEAFVDHKQQIFFSVNRWVLYFKSGELHVLLDAGGGTLCCHSAFVLVGVTHTELGCTFPTRLTVRSAMWRVLSTQQVITEYC